MRQYELWWAQMPDPIGRRPVLLLSRNPAYEYLTRVIVVEITSTIRSIPVEVSLGPGEGLRHRSVANFDNVHLAAKQRLLSYWHPQASAGRRGQARARLLARLAGAEGGLKAGFLGYVR